VIENCLDIKSAEDCLFESTGGAKISLSTKLNGEPKVPVSEQDSSGSKSRYSNVGLIKAMDRNPLSPRGGFK